MTKAELLSWYTSLHAKNIPRYIEVPDANYSQVLYDGKWRNVIYSWSIFENNNDAWKYVETDYDRGYVSVLKSFDTENAAATYAKNTLIRKQLAATAKNSHEDMLSRYIQKHYNYSEQIAQSMVEHMLAYRDIFDEFFNFARIGKFSKEDGTKTEICGYTAQILHQDYGLSPLGVYNYLVYLRETPEEAIENLKKGLPDANGAVLK